MIAVGECLLRTGSEALDRQQPECHSASGTSYSSAPSLFDDDIHSIKFLHRVSQYKQIQASGMVAISLIGARSVMMALSDDMQPARAPLPTVLTILNAKQVLLAEACGA